MITPGTRCPFNDGDLFPDPYGEGVLECRWCHARFHAHHLRDHPECPGCGRQGQLDLVSADGNRRAVVQQPPPYPSRHLGSDRPRVVIPPPYPAPVNWGWIVFSVVILVVIIAILVSRMQSGTSAGVLPPPNQTGILVDELANTSVGNTYGISWTNGIGGHGAVFSAANASRIEYPGRIPSEATIEFWIKVDSGYQYQNYAFRGNLDSAMIFSTDPEGGDVTWPGTTKLFVSRNGNVSLFVANYKYNQPPTASLDAQGTPFRFGEWHAIGFSVGNVGQFIMVDGNVVAADQNRTQPMGCSGTHVSPADIPTVGETVSHYWPHHQYEGGFEGIVARFRASPKQQDWDLARGVAAIPPQPLTSSQTQTDDGVATQLLQEAQTLFEQRQYSEALTRCNTLLERDPNNLQAAELKNRIEKVVDILDHAPQPATSSQTQTDDEAATQLLQEAQTLFEQGKYSEALTRCNTLLERDPNNSPALELRQRIQKAIDILKP